MTSEDRRYQFLAERIQNALMAHSGDALGPDDLDDLWDDLVTDGSEWAVLITQDSTRYFVSALAAVGSGRDARHGAWHSTALTQLAEHADCETVLAELTAERDDVIDSIVQARDYAINDAYPGEYGDPYVSVEPFLDQLRPAIRGNRPFVSLDLDQWPCRECGESWLHEDWCSVQQAKDELATRREHAVRSHLHCLEMGQALTAHTAQCIEQVEAIAHTAHRTSREIYDDLVVSPDDVLEAIRLADLDTAALEPATAANLATAIYPRLRDAD